MKNEKLKIKNNYGISLIETIIAVAIGIVLMTVILVSISGFRDNRLLDVAADQALSVISDARSKTLNSEGASRYGVHIEASKVTLFKGAVYNQADSYNKITAISSLLEIANISLNGGGADIVFKRLSGKTDNNGSFVIRLKSDASKSKTISVKNTGVANIQ